MFGDYKGDIHLYVKAHKVTGLQYFGRTKGNPDIYPGSGMYWQRHLIKHGKDVASMTLFTCKETDELISYALGFSAANDIVLSPKWANLIVEDGKNSGAVLFGEDNGFYGKTHSDEQKAIWRVSRTGQNTGKNNPNYGGGCFGSANGMYGNTHLDSSKEKMSKLKKGKAWIYNLDLKTHKLVLPEEVEGWINEGWIAGRIRFNKTKKKIRL